MNAIVIIIIVVKQIIIKYINNYYSAIIIKIHANYKSKNLPTALTISVKKVIYKWNAYSLLNAS